MQHYNLILKAITYLEKNFRHQPKLEELSEELGVSMFHLQRTFREWVGISPKRFLQFLTLEYARKLLDESRSVLETTYETGMSSPGRMHDLFVTIDAVSPGDYKARGSGMQIRFGLHESPFGLVLISITERGVCGLSFHEPSTWIEGLNCLRQRWVNAEFIKDQHRTASYRDRIFSRVYNNNGTPIKLILNGTNFQLKVWEALLRIPEGFVCSYQDIANWIGKPDASRAVGNAVGANPISYLIPCHRVIRSSGIIGDYHWGATRKKSIFVWENAKKNQE